MKAIAQDYDKQLCQMILEYTIEIDVINKRLDMYFNREGNYRADVVSSLISKRDTLLQVIAQIKHILKIA